MTTSTGCGTPHVELAALLSDARSTAAEQVSVAAMGTFPPGFRLEEMTPLPLNCTDAARKPTGRVMLGLTFWINGISSSQNSNYFDRLKTWWRNRGWTLSTDSRPADMFMNASRDGYLMSLRATVRNRLVMGNTTPCAVRDTTASPPLTPVSAASNRLAMAMQPASPLGQPEAR